MANDSETQDQKTTIRQDEEQTETRSTLSSDDYLHSGLLDSGNRHLDKAHDYHLDQDIGVSSEQVNANLHLGSHEGDANRGEQEQQTESPTDQDKDAAAAPDPTPVPQAGSDLSAQAAADLSALALTQDPSSPQAQVNSDPQQHGSSAPPVEHAFNEAKGEVREARPDVQPQRAQAEDPGPQSVSAENAEKPSEDIQSGLSPISDANSDENAVDEDAAIGSATGIQASAGSSDGTSVTYSLLEDADGLFEIDPESGIVSVAGVLDAETAGSHDIVVLATASDGGTRTETFTISVRDVDESPVSPITDLDTSPDRIAENASVGTTVGVTAQASDPDATATVTYQVDDPRFEIDENGVVSVAAGASFDAETEGGVSFTVTAISSDGSTSTQVFNLAVSDINEFDTSDVTDTDPAENVIAENVAAGASVGITAFAEDEDVSDTVSYSVSDDRFAVSGDGMVTIAEGATFDAETESAIDVTVTAESTDGSRSEETFSINVSNIIDEAPTDIGVTGGDVDENSLAGTVVATLSASDGDADDVHTYAITADPSGFFEIVGDEIRVREDAALDHETASEHTITVEVTDAAGLSYSEDITLVINDVNEAPDDLIVSGDNRADFTAADGYSSASSVSDMGLESDTNVFSMSFTTASDVTTAQTLFETGGNVYGLNVVIENGRLNVYAGNGNDLELSAEILPGTDYNIALELDKNTDTITLLMSDELALEEMTVSNSLADRQTGWTDSDWDGGNNFGVGEIAGHSQGHAGGDFLGTINGDGLSVYANAALDDYLKPLVDENSSSGTVIATLATSDQDAGDAHSYEITDDPSGFFEIVGNEIRVKDDAALDYETESEHTITIETSDAEGLTHSEAVTIAVNDVNEAPTSLVLNTGNQADFVAADGYASRSSVSDMGLESNSNVFSMSFTTASDITTAQTLFETGGNVYGLNVVIENGQINVYAGNGNNLELSAAVTPDTEYSFALELDKDGDTLTLLLSDDLPLDEMTVSNSLVDQRTGWTDGDWDGGNDFGVGAIAGHSQGHVGGDFLGTINGEGLSVYTNATVDDFLGGSLEENAVGATIGALSVADPDAGESHTYEVSDGRFEVAGGTLRLKSDESIDFETEPTVDVTVTATDSGAKSITETFTVAFEDVAEGLQLGDGGVVFTDTGISETSITGGTGNDTITANDDGGDLDGGAGDDTLAGGAGDDEIDGGSGSDFAVFSGLRADYDVLENADGSFTVSDTRDGSPDGTDTVWNVETFRFADGDVLAGDLVAQDVSDVIDTDAAENTVSEDAGAGSTVGITAHAEDANVSDTVSYSVDDDRFDVAEDGAVTVAEDAVFDAETERAADVTVTVVSSDGSSSQETFTIRVSDVNEFSVSGVTDTDAAADTIAENAAAGSETGITASAGDDDVSDTVSYRVDDDRFDVAEDGTVTVAAGASFDYETEPTVSLTVTATSTDGSISQETFTVDVGDVVETLQLGNSGVTKSDTGVAEAAMVGGAGNDTLEAHEDGGVLNGGDGADTLIGDAGDDTLDGGAGADNDTLRGGDGSDTYLLHGDGRADIISDTGTSGTDRIVLSAETGTEFELEDTFSAAAQGIEEIDGSAVDGETLRAQRSNSQIDWDFTGVALNGVDQIEGRDRDDSITGSAGDDTILGGGGNDTLSGSGGDDTIDGGSGTDTVTYSGNRADYSITDDAGAYTITDTRSGTPDGTDTVVDVEHFQFTDGTVAASDLLNSAPTDLSFSGNSDLKSAETGGGDAVITGEIVADGSGALSVDHWSIRHEGGDLTIDVLARGFESGDLDSQVYLYRDNGGGDFTLVGRNDDGEAGGDGSTHSSDSLISETGLEAGNYMVVIGSWPLNVREALSTASDHPASGLTSGPYQITITGDASVTGFTDNPAGGGKWGDPGNNAIIVSDGADRSAIPEDSVVAGISSVTDANAGDAFHFAFTDDGDGAFQIDANSDDISLAGAHDASAPLSDTVSVQVTDSGNASYQETLGIELGTDSGDTINGSEHEDIIYGFGGDDTIDGGDGSDTMVLSGQQGDYHVYDNGDGSLTLTDTRTGSPDGTNTVSNVETYSFADGDVQRGDLTLSTEVLLSDSDNSGNTIHEVADVGTEVGISVSAMNPGGGALAYSLSDDRFSIDGDGVVTIASHAFFDSQVEGAIDLTVTATSADGSEASETFSVSVTGDYDTEVTGGMGNGSFNGSDGSYSVDGVGGRDTIQTGDFNDRIEGGSVAGADQITGNGGRDLLFGEGGQDVIRGGDGDDIIIGGTDRDTLSGGDGSDLFMHGLGDGNDAVYGGAGGGWIDVIDLGGGPGVTSAGEYGNDWTVTITSGTIEITDAENGRLDLSDDAIGSIDFTDGTRIDFAQIEEIRW